MAKKEQKPTLEYRVVIPSFYRAGVLKSIETTEASSESQAIRNVFARYFGKETFGIGKEYHNFKYGMEEENKNTLDYAFPIDGISEGELARNPDLRDKLPNIKHGLLRANIMGKFGDKTSKYAEIARILKVILSEEQKDNAYNCASRLAEAILGYE